MEQQTNYSARVSLCLIVGDVEISLASVGEVCTAQVPLSHELPESDGFLVIDVDGDVARYFVHVEKSVGVGARDIHVAAHPYIPLEYAAARGIQDGGTSTRTGPGLTVPHSVPNRARVPFRHTP
jgi:hypothetical protein